MANRMDRDRWEARLRTLGLTGRLPDRLTQKVVDAALAHPVAERFQLAAGRGLALCVYPPTASDRKGAANWSLQVRTLAGRSKHIGIGSAADVSLEAARAEADRQRTLIKAGKDPVQEKRTARVEARAAEASTLERFVTDHYGPVLVSRNRRDAEGAIDRIRASWKCLLSLPLTQISEEKINDAIEARKALKKEDGSRLLSNGTLRRDWATFRPCLVFAREKKLIAGLPIEGKPQPLQGLREEPSKRYLGKDDPKELDRFLKALESYDTHEPGRGEFARVACALALNAGLRRGEVVRLTDAMVNITDAGRERLELPGAICKGNRGRVVPLNAAAIAAIKRWLEVRKTFKVENLTGELFPGEPKLWADRLTQRDFPRIAEAAKTEAVFKTLRATFASLHVQRGTPLQIVQMWLGHSSITLTERHYAYLRPESGQDLARAFRVQ